MISRSAELKPGSIWAMPDHVNGTAAKTQQPAASESAPQPLDSHADVVVVGAGIAGLSAALHLLRSNPGSRIIVLEAQHIGFGASTRNSGMLTPGVGQSLARLVKRFGPVMARQMYVTSLDAVEYVAQLAEQEGMDIGLRRSGQLIIARGRGGRSRLACQAKLMSELTLPFSTLDDAQLARRLRLPGKAPGTGPAAVHLPIAGVLDPARLVSGFAKAVRDRGGTIIERAKVEKILASQVLLEDGRTIHAQKIVVATNAYDTSLSAQRGRLVPMHLRMLSTRPLTDRELESIGWQAREGVIDSRRLFNYFRLREDNRLLFGGGLPRYRWGGNVNDIDRDSDLRRLTAEMRELFPFLSERDIQQTWTGAIAYSLDTLPTIGKVSRESHVLHLGGWSGHGIALSIYFGQLIADLVAGNPYTPALWFRNRAPRVPSELGRWCGTRLGAWTARLFDRFA